MVIIGLILFGLLIYFSVIHKRAENEGCVTAKVINTKRGVFCYVLFELTDGTRINLQVPNKDYAKYVIGDEGFLKYYKDTFHSFDRKYNN